MLMRAEQTVRDAPLQLQGRRGAQEPGSEHRAAARRHGHRPVTRTDERVEIINVQARIAGIVLSLLAAGATPALAQSPPFRGLFGQPSRRPRRRKSLDLSTSLFGVNDTNLPRLVARDFRPTRGRTFTTPTCTRVSGTRNEASARRFRPTGRRPCSITLGSPTPFDGAAPAPWALTRTGRRMRFGLDQQVRYSPYAHFRVIPIRGAASTSLANVSAPDAALAVSGRESYRYNSGIHTGYQLSRRIDVRCGVPARDPRFRAASVRATGRRRTPAVSLTHSMTPKTALVAGYGYHRRDFEGERVPLRRHDFNFGVNYNSALPFSQRTLLTFTSDRRRLSRERSTPVATSDSTFLRMIGRAELDHQLGQAWHVGLCLPPRVQYIEGISDVFLADSVTGNLRGYLGPRRRVTSHGRLLDRSAPIRAAPARIRHLREALRACGWRFRAGWPPRLSTCYYRYLFADAVTLPTGIRARENRHVFRVGLTTWLPLLK